MNKNKIILEIFKGLSDTTLSVGERLQRISEKIADFLKRRCCVYVGEEKTFYLMAGFPPEFHGLWQRFPFSEHPSLKEVFNRKQSLLIKDVRDNQYLTESQRKWALGTDVSSILFVPIILREEILGVIVLDILSGERITRREIVLAQQIASHIAWAINDARLYEKLQRKEEKLAEAVRLATLGEEWLKFTHELRNPLATIGGFARRLLDSFSDDDLRRKEIKIIVEEVDKLEESIKRHLEFGQGKISFTPWSINDLIKETLSEFRGQTNFPKERIQTDFSPGLPYIPADEFQLKRAFLNILRNAQEAMGEEGMIWLKTWQEDNFCWVEISNTSQGKRIPEEVLDRIFEPFFTTKEEGIGLGLATVYKILEHHNSEISVTSDEHKTSFTMKFPAL